MSFAESGFAQFMAGTAGRAIRIIAGLVLIAWGYPHRAETAGTVLPAIGVLLLVVGALDICLISALFGGPLRGADIRRLKPRP